MDARHARYAESAFGRRVSSSATVATLGAAMSGLGARSALRLAVVLALMLAMFFGPVPAPSASAAGAVATDTNDHAGPERRVPAGTVEIVAEAEESRDELEEQGTAPAAGLLCAGCRSLASLHSVAFKATGAAWWIGRLRLGDAASLGRGPPSRV